MGGGCACHAGVCYRDSCWGGWSKENPLLSLRLQSESVDLCGRKWRNAASEGWGGIKVVGKIVVTVMVREWHTVCSSLQGEFHGTDSLRKLYLLRCHLVVSLSRRSPLYVTAARAVLSLQLCSAFREAGVGEGGRNVTAALVPRYAKKHWTSVSSLGAVHTL